MPVVLLGVMNYWKSGDVNWKYGLVIALTFFIGAYFGSKLSLKLQPGLVKFLFGLLMALVFLWFRHIHLALPITGGAVVALWPLWFPPAYYLGAYSYVWFLIRSER